MRNFALKTAIAAILVSTSLASVNAASIGSPAQAPGQAISQAKPALDEMPTASVKAAPTKAHAVRKIAYRPRLENIVGKVSAANHRIRIDHGRGLLTKAEFRTLQARAHDIRRDAIRTAEQHRGRLPHASYVAFQTRLERLNHSIRHDARA